MSLCGGMAVGTLRVRGVAENHTALRLALASVLSGADLRPREVSPAAVLIVRRLVDPLPGRLVAKHRAVIVDAAWERAARNALTEIYRRAARPALGAVPANAEAVLFADEGEMLACLALDMVRGEALAHWWWRAILRSLPSPSAAGLTTLLCERSTSVPAALHHLAERGRAVRVVEALSPAQARAILAAMARAYRLAGLPLDVDGAARPAAGEGQGTAGGGLEAKGPDSRAPPVADWDRARYDAAMSEPAPPWLPGIVPPDLDKERSCLLGVGLSLYRRPAVVRSTTFQAALADWWSHPASGAGGQRVAPNSGQPAPIAVQDRVRRAGGTELAKARSVTSGEETSAGQARRPAATVAPAGFAPGGHQLGEDPTSAPLAGIESRAGGAKEPDGESRHRAMPAPDETRQRLTGSQELTAAEPDGEVQVAARGDSVLGLEGGVRTQLGGVLYLINLMAHLDLPACFEAGWRLDSQVGSWGVLELLGRGLLALDGEPLPSGGQPLESDPLWAALARLDGREPGELPGVTYHGGDAYRLPTGWAVPAAGDEGIYYRASRRRLRLWSEEGYVLFDVPRDGSPPRKQAAGELGRCLAGKSQVKRARAASDRAPLADLTGPLVAGLNRCLARWLALVLSYIRVRLEKGLSPDGIGSPDLGQELLLRPAWLYVTSTHVDLAMSLDCISLPVRLAGLDCNPGWMPAFARVVLFHFD
jgi:hypothetical protein